MADKQRTSSDEDWGVLAIGLLIWMVAMMVLIEMVLWVYRG